jgi:hypothetical protein
MDSKEQEKMIKVGPDEGDMRAVVRNVLHEFMELEKTRSEPAYKAELLEERKRRELLEQRLNTLAEENLKTRQRADEAEKNAVIHAELQKLGVVKVDLAFKAVKDDISRGEDGGLLARTGDGDLSLREYLKQFVHENPELLPARMVGGSGSASGQRTTPIPSPSVDLDKIKPGMDPEEMKRVRDEISRIAQQSWRGN